ncbi:DNA translocase FtsK [Candidatus Paracaedibacter symbiosus]|uniref:DNA translocase FtsK n=1 Tax=Candidatus Paracaedibacter symbiosus TaxID=244582 RepID=UPI000509A209|nr:DNA translocase FtsK [Candidatus Paracaedibacter symbiosus]
MARRKAPHLKSSLLPEAMILQFHRRFRQVTGVLISLLALVFATTLFSYSPQDPSLNAATTVAASNILSLPGAIVADFFIQGFGLAPILLILAILVWGGFLIAEIPIKRFSLKLVSLCLAFLTFATFLGLFTNHTSYLTTPSLGGAFGILTLLKLTRTLGWMPAAISILSFGLFIPLYFYSLGIRPAQWQRFLHSITIVFAGLFRYLVYPTIHLLKKATRGKNQKIAPPLLKEESTAAFARKSTIILNADAQRRSEIHESYQAFFASPSSEPSLSEEDDSIREDLSTLNAEEFFPYPTSEPTPSMAATARVKIKQPSQAAMTSASSEFVYSPALHEDYQLPSPEFLQPAVKKNSAILAPEILQQAAQQLEQVLQEFGVRGEIVAVCPGPVVTLYELKPAPGIKTSRVIGLADDIARSMSAHAARIAVIPGRNVIGIELPNKSRETVYLRELLQSDSYIKFSSPLALILGKDIGGNPIIADLARMPHLLVAGTTGSGKSVSINTMILSVLFRLSPDKCKFIMIDPKMLELSVYDGIPHLLSPVVTDPKKAVVALKWAVREMENRYRAMSKLGVRNIDGYNDRLAEAKLSGELLMRRVQTGFDPDTGKPIFENQSLAVDPLPYIIVVVDEMADLMLVAGKEIEAAVQRLAQMARAAGIHLIMATQRPSVDVITGTIKANFPTRISFQVTSKIDSRTILGEQGAEQLLGQGDMLYMMGGGRLSRVHGPFVRDDEVEKIVQFLKMQGEPSYIESITEDDEEFVLGSNEEDSRNGGDALYQQAIEIIRREGKVSTSFVQRHLQIGYNRAARIIEQMEKEGIVGPANHVGKREIL